jgi:2-polyprenyl-6-methoxyphenol hydroxylase-like FAD-dependent oxidoreductase
MAADVVVDAMGRTSRVPGWLGEEGLDPAPEHRSECGLVYHSRHFRIREDAGMPPYASLLAGPRGDLGYLAFATFVGDSRTFCLCIMTSPGDREFAALRRDDVFLRVAERLPGVASWIDPAVAVPITPVLPMGRLRNTWRRYVVDGRPVAPGLQPVGDSLCHTNPTFAFGASLALRDAFVLTDALDTTRDESDLACTVDAQVGEDSRRRYEAVTAEDRERARLWSGEPIDVTDPNASMPLFLRSVVYRMAVHDSSILRAVCRRVNLLDPPDALERDTGLLVRAKEIFEGLRADGSLGPPAPPRSDLLASLEA